MIVIFLDFETVVTDPVDAKKMPPIELGAILYDTNLHKIIRMESFLIWDRDDEAYFWSDDIERITGIAEEHLLEHALDPKTALERFFNDYLSKAVSFDASEENPQNRIIIIAHNGLRFDKIVFEEWAAKHSYVLPVTFRELLKTIQWVDTICDFEYPKELTTRKLSYMAAELGFVNPFPHRALPDTMTLMRVASMFDIERAVKRSTLPKVEAVADCKKPWQDPQPDGNKDTDFAKARGYKFDAAKKLWTRTILESEVEQEREACKDRFKVGIIRKESNEKT